MQVGFDEFFVAQLQPCRGDCTRDHQTRLPEKVLVVLAALAAKRHYQGGLSTPTCASTSLCIIRGRRRYVSEMNYVQVADVYTQFHRRGAKQHCQITSTEPCFAILAQLHRNLPCMGS